jgi:hypothetical protein
MAYRHIMVLLGLVGSALTVVAACDSSSDPAPNDPNGASSGGPNADAGGSNADAGPGTLGAKCAAAKTIDECADCCGGSDSIAAYEQAFTQCACEGPCKTQCAATLCAPTPNEPDEACDECFAARETAAACHTAGADACEQDVRCKNFIACDEVAQCLFKEPDTDGGR